MRVLFIIVSWLFFTTCSAQNPYAIHINQFSGLPSNEIYDIFEDNKGFVWLATDLGITRFDGVSFVTYNPPSPYSKAGGSIKQDHLGNIWYCTYDGNIFMLKDGYMKKMNANPVIGYDYAFDKEHLIYQAFDTIFVQSLYAHKILKKIPNSSETLTGVISRKSLFATINNIRLRSFEANGKELSEYSLGPLQANLLVFDGRYFFAGNKNNNTKNVQIFDGAELVGNIKFDIVCYLNRLNVVDKKLWLATTKGVFLCDDNKTRIVETFFPGQSISKVMKDRKGNYWFSTTNNGVFIVPKLNNFTYKLEGFKPKQIRKIDGGLIANSEFGDFHEVQPQGVTLLQKNVKDKRVFDIISFATPSLDIDENTIGGFLYKGRHLYYSMQGCKEFANIDDKYLVMALSHSIFMVKKKNIDAPSPWDLIYNKYKNNNVNSLHECKLVKWGARAKSVVFNAMDNSIYCATNQGILVYDKQGVMHEEKCDNKFINATKILVYKDVVFALDYNGGILCKKSGKHFNVSKTLTNNSKTRQLKLCDSLLFMVKENVIEYVELDKQNLQTLEFKVNKLSLPINAALVNSVEFDNGYLYLAYNGELLKLKLEELRPINIEKDFILTGISFNNVLTQPDRFIKVADGMNDVEIQFSILDFLNPNSHHIEYQINEESWKTIAPHTRKLNLASLASGEYEIKFRIDHNIFKQKVQFSIAYPWYQQWWFFALLLVSIGLLVYRIIRWRLDVVQHENQLLLEKKVLENNLNNSILMSIKSQMNPHFLFNALNTIQSYIITEDKKNASSYLSKFSKLTRKILEMSEKDKVSLAEELESLQLYIDLEKIRFDTLSTSITVDPNINTEAVFIPSMIIQPYIENAIKHGLLHKKGDKSLTINIEKLNEQTILFIIDDNGIGRKKSNELNQIKHKGHHSFASDANQKRLEILNMGNKNISIEYIDKVDADQAPTGTTVRLTVPHSSSNN